MGYAASVESSSMPVDSITSVLSVAATVNVSVA